MKKLSLIFVIGVFFSCSTDNNEANENSNNAANFHLKAQSNNLRVYYDNGGDDYGCSGSGGNCLPDVIITPNLHVMAEGIGNVLSAGSADEVQNFFQNNYDGLAQFIDPVYIEGTINGYYNVSSKGDINDRFYIRFANQNNEFEAVYPMLAQGNNLRVYYDNGGDDYGCSGSGGNCLPDVIITPSVYQMAQSIETILSAGSQDEVQNFFQDNYESLVEFISPNYIEGTLSGYYHVSCRGHVDEKFYLLFASRSENGEITPDAVYPLVN